MLLKVAKKVEFLWEIKMSSLKFLNTVRPYRQHTSKELLATLLVSRLCTIPAFVLNSMKLIKAGKSIFGEDAVSYYMDITAGQVFSAGETEQQLKSVIRKLHGVGAYPIVDYCAEGVEKRFSLELNENFEAIKRGIKLVRGDSWSSTAIKVSALVDMPTLIKLNSIQLQLERGSDLNSRYETSVFSKIALPTHQISKLSDTKDTFDLTIAELQAARDCITKVEAILDLAKECNVSVMVDAEQTYLQAAIDSLTVQLQRVYNTKQAIVCNTFQCYLHETADRVPAYIDFVRIAGFKSGIKLVRGAYMNEESRLAQMNSIASPLNPSKEATDHVYNQNLTRAMDVAGKGSLLCVATHNDSSIEFAQQLMRLKSIDKRFGGVVFAQLLGMKDLTTASLAKSQYLTAKYVPFGPTNKLVPYLIRRALESYHMVDSLKEVEQLVLKEFVVRSALTRQQLL